MRAAVTNEAIARMAIEEIWNQRNPDAIDHLCAANYMAREPRAGDRPGREGLRQMVCAAHSAAPGARLSVDLVVAQGDRVAVGYSVQNGSRARVRGALHVRIARGQIRESWGTVRLLELLQGGGSA